MLNEFIRDFKRGLSRVPSILPSFSKTADYIGRYGGALIHILVALSFFAGIYVIASVFAGVEPARSRRPILSFVGNLAEYSAISIIFATVIVYLIRILHWVRMHGPAYWNSETPPYFQGSEGMEARINRPIDSSRSKFVVWFAISISLWTLFILSVGILGILIEVTTISNPFPSLSDYFSSDIATSISDIVHRFPIIGDLLAIYERFPGQTLLGRLSYIVISFPLAVSIRNIVFIFEHRDSPFHPEKEHIKKEVQAFYLCVIIGIAYIIGFSLLTYAVFEVWLS